jgi:spore germination protein YaaH
MGKIFFKWVFLISLFFGFFLSSLFEVKASTYERLFYFVEGENARASFFAHPEYIDIFAPQTYSVDAKGFLFGTIKPDLLSFAKKNNIRVMPLLTNGAFSQNAGHTLLDDKNAQETLIKAMIEEARDFGYIGWQIDFEQMELSYRDKFSEFVERIYQDFQKHNLKLSVAVIAQISEEPKDYPKNLWQRIIGVYDYGRLASTTDFISLMSYDDPNSLGPVAGRLWLEKVIAFSLTKIPKEKISLGIPFYYWRWDDAAMKRVGIGGNKNLNNLMKEHKLKFSYDMDEQAPYFHFWDKGKSYTGWYENGRSIGYKISLIQKNKLRGFSAWALGLELPSVYGVMK